MRRDRGAAVAVALLIALATVPTATAGARLAPGGVVRPAQLPLLPSGFALQDEPIERQIGQAAKGAITTLRRSFNTISWIFRKAFKWWSKWLRQAVPYLLLAMVVALADAALLDAWRQEGFRALAAYVPMMLYVYARLLFSRGVRLIPKLLLIGALVYGVVRNDLNPDGYLTRLRMKDLARGAEDFVLIIIATRYFVYACPEYLVQAYAEQAVLWRRRMMALARRSR